MPRIKINNTTLDKIKKPSQGQMFYWDTELKGFGVRATPGGLVFVVQRDIDGKTTRQVIGRYGAFTQAQARTEAIASLAQLSAGVNINEKEKEDKTKQVTFREAYEAYKKSKSGKKALRPRTIETYDGALRRCLPDWLDKPLANITKEMIEDRHRLISDTPGVRRKGSTKGNGDRTADANSCMRVLRRVFNYAATAYEDAEGKPLFPDNPVKRLSQLGLWNKTPRKQDVIHAEDLASWYAAVMALENIAVRDYLLLCLFTGLRRSEAMKLKWAYVDYKKAKTLTIPGVDTKNHDEHRLPLSDFLIDLLKTRFKDRRLDNPYVFSAEEGSKHIAEPKRVIASVINASGVKFSMHTLRRTFETTAERLDLPYYALKRLLNHRISNDVTSGYIVTQVDRLKEPMQKIADYFKEKCGISFAQNEKAHG